MGDALALPVKAEWARNLRGVRAGLHCGFAFHWVGCLWSLVYVAK